MNTRQLNSFAYLTDFHSVVPRPPIPQEVMVEYTTRMMAVAKCVREKITSAEKADQAYQEISENMKKFSVSSKYISKRQAYSFPDHPEKILADSTTPYTDVFKNIQESPFGEDLGKRMDYYDKVCTSIFDSLYTENASKPDDLIHVTCAGYLSPSPAQRFLNKRRWLDVTATHSYHMGCYGAFPPVRMAAGFLSHALLLEQERKQVDIVHTELLFTHLDISKYDANNIVNMTLFADGFIKYSVKTARKSDIPAGSFALLSMQDQIIKDTLSEMSWKPGNYQFDMYLSKAVPGLIRDMAVNFLTKLCAKGGIDFAEEKSTMIFAIHPGGPKILDHLQELLGIEDWQLQFSRQVLYENGNMSSATIPHIWKKILEEDSVKSGTKIATMAFGPGLTATGFILEKI